MRSVEQLRTDFAVYFDEIDRCLGRECYWALLHVLLVLPDICSSLEAPSEKVGKRYTNWCAENMPSNPHVTPGDRYQMRCAVLHQGTSEPQNHARDAAERTNYSAFSFVDPKNFEGPVHQTVSGGANTILNIDVAELAKDTKLAMDTWFAKLQTEPHRLSRVIANLPTLVRVKPKVVEVEFRDSSGALGTFLKYGNTTSST